MCYKLLDCLTLWDIFSLIIGIVLSALFTIYIIRFFRPKINICIPIIEDNIIKITVQNISKRYSATNIKIEASALINDNTFHLDFDRFDFLILSPYCKRKEEKPYERTYHAHDINSYTKNFCPDMNTFFELLKLENSYLRIRVHAQHSFTNFGKAFETNFILTSKGYFKQLNDKKKVLILLKNITISP